MFDFQDPAALIIVLIIAFAPAFVILLKPKRPSEPMTSFIKFNGRNKRKKILLMIGVLLLFLLALSLAIKFNVLNLLLGLVLTRKFVIYFQLIKFEDNKLLTYDYEGGVIEYTENDHTRIFYMKDIESVQLHQYQFADAKVADMHFKNGKIRISSGLVDFGKVPFLEVEGVNVTNYYLKFLIPE